MAKDLALVLTLVSFAGCASAPRTARVEAPPPAAGRPVSHRLPAPAVEPPLAAAPDEEDEAEVALDAAPPVEPPGDPFAGRLTPDGPGLAGAVAASARHWQAARVAFRARDIDRARELFDQAVDALCVEEHPEAGALADALTENVAAYEAAWAELQEGEEEEEEPAPIDAITDVRLPEVAGEASRPEGGPSSRLANDVPLEVNNQVLYMLEVYRGRLKDEVTAAFVRSGRFLPMIQEVFREEGVPQDLAWLALVESGFKAHAYSRAAAKGLWQFIRPTGRLYGLEASYWVDERADPEKATRAAARHLRDLYGHFGDWYLSLAAYNAGAGKVDRAIRRVGRRDYWALASSRHLRAETRNYVPAFLATLLIVQDPRKHGFDYTSELPWSFERASIEGPADLEVIARAAGTSAAEMRELNPELRRGVTPAGGYALRLPLGTGGRFESAWAALPPGERLRHAVHTVGRGESLARIARRYGVRAEAIWAANGLGGKGSVPAGTELRIPLSPGFYPPPGWRDDEGRRRASSAAGGRFKVHRVRRGETVAGIAARYGLSVGELRRVNGLGSARSLQAGTRLKVSSSGKARTATAQARAVRHKVRRGETLSTIAGRYGVRIQDLARWNGRRVSALLQAGQTLTVFLR